MPPKYYNVLVEEFFTNKLATVIQLSLRRWINDQYNLDLGKCVINEM